LSSEINPFDVIGPVPFPDLADLATSGIYFLHLDGEVVYVGKAVHMRRRIGQHLADDAKVFDAVSFVRCEVEQLDTMERRYIRHLLPRYNQCALAKGQKDALAFRGISRSQPPVGGADILDDEIAARFLGISVDELLDYQRRGLGPRSVQRRGKGRRYPVAILRKFAIGHLSAIG